MHKRGTIIFLLLLPVVLPSLTALVALGIPDQEHRFYVGYFSAILTMLGIALSSILIWQHLSRTELRWFGIGAGIWLVGVLLKFIAAGLTFEAGLALLATNLPYEGYLVLGALYSGLFTGVFEGGITLAAGLMWRKLSVEGKRAVAVGIGAGAMEVIYILYFYGGLGVLSTILSDTAFRQDIVSAWKEAAVITAIPWLAPPYERFYALLAHTSARTLILLAIATRRWRYFWYGFGILTGIDAIAGYFHLSGLVNTISIWWTDLSISTPALLSALIIPWCLHNWPKYCAALQEPTVLVRSQTELSSWKQRYSNAQPTWHLLLLSVLTSGLYELYWFYKNWRHLKLHRNLCISPGWRTAGLLVPILNFFLIYRQFRDIKSFALELGSETYYSPGKVALGYTFLSVASLAISLYSAQSTNHSVLLGFTLICFTVALAATLLLMVIQKILNACWATAQPHLPLRTNFSRGEILLLVIGGIVTILLLLEPFILD